MTTTFAEHYRDLLREIACEESEYEWNRRTNSGLAFLPEGYSFQIDLIDNLLPTCGLRRTRPHIAAAETAWCFMGSTSTGWLKQHTHVWDEFEDGNGDIWEAYGYRWKHAFSFDQVAMAIERLQRDHTDRRIWISSYLPERDLLNSGQKTVPCPVGFTLSMHDNYLNSSLMIRSSDVVTGLPYDVMRHALVLRAIACSISDRVNVGHVRFTLAHPHIYESQWKIANEMLEQDIMTPEIEMPTDWNIRRIANNPDHYVMEIRNKVFASTGWPDCDPKIEVVK